MRRTGLSRLSGGERLGGRKNIASWKLPSSGQRAPGRAGLGGPRPPGGSPQAARGLPAAATSVGLAQLPKVRLSRSQCSRCPPCPTLPRQQQPPAPPTHCWPHPGLAVQDSSQTARPPPQGASGGGKGLCGLGPAALGQTCLAPVPAELSEKVCPRERPGSEARACPLLPVGPGADCSIPRSLRVFICKLGVPVYRCHRCGAAFKDGAYEKEPFTETIQISGSISLRIKAVSKTTNGGFSIFTRRSLPSPLPAPPPAPHPCPIL